MTSEPLQVPLKVTVPADGNGYYFRLKTVSSKVAMTFFVLSGGSVDLRAPIGTYMITGAKGEVWYGAKARFGPNTRYFRLGDQFDFKAEERDGEILVSGNEITLVKQRNGNLAEREISEGEF